MKKGIVFYANSNVPNNHPNGCSYGAYIFIKTTELSTGKAIILYIDSSHFCTAIGIDSASTSINWKIY